MGGGDQECPAMTKEIPVSAMGPSREELDGGEAGGTPVNSMASNISDQRRLSATLIELVPQTKAPAASHGEGIGGRKGFGDPACVDGAHRSIPQEKKNG